MSFRAMLPGRPMRFLYLVLCLWFAGRAATLLLGEGPPAGGSGDRHGRRGNDIWRGGLAVKPAWPTERFRSPAPAQELQARSARLLALRPVAEAGNATARRSAPAPAPAPALVIAAARFGPAQKDTGIFDRPPDFPAIVPPADAANATEARDRWSLSAWMLYRPDNPGPALANAGQLGASQMGARLAYDLSPASPYSLAIHARVTSALQSPAGAETAIGLTWRPKRTVPVSLSIERRVALAEGGRNAFAAYAAGGFGPAPLGAGFELEGYAQAGIVGAARTDAFADGRIAVAGRLLDDGSGSALTAGLALSGGAQPSLSRLDIGPQIVARFPLGNSFARATLEWRERVAGSARPASGPALVLAADF